MVPHKLRPYSTLSVILCPMPKGFFVLDMSIQIVEGKGERLGKVFTDSQVRLWVKQKEQQYLLGNGSTVETDKQF